MKERACTDSDNISLRLIGYNDIFSNFDPRPYSEKAISVDFLEEARRASIDKPSGQIQLRIMVPGGVRSPEKERTIQKRLKNHFDRHAKIMKKQHKSVIRNGLIFTLSGILTMFLAALMSFTFTDNSILWHFLIILFEPAGWFLFWEGLNQIVFESKKVHPEMEFYEKMAKSDIKFLSC